MTIIPDNILKLISPADRKALGKAGLTAEEAMARCQVRQERDLQNLLKNLLSHRGIWYAWTRMDKKNTSKLGTPDFLFAVNGKACAWECKIGNERMSEEQQDTSLKMIGNGWHFAVIRSYDEGRAFLGMVEEAGG